VNFSVYVRWHTEYLKEWCQTKSRRSTRATNLMPQQMMAEYKKINEMNN